MGSIGAGGKSSTVSYQRARGFDEALFNKLPKKLQVKNIIDIGKEKHADGTRYFAVIQFDDGFQRSIGEYNMKDFKSYIDDILNKNRNIEY